MKFDNNHIKALRASGYSWDDINDMIADEMKYEEEMEEKAKAEAAAKEEVKVKELEKASYINDTRTDLLNALALYMEANGVTLDEETRVMVEGLLVDMEKMIENAEVSNGKVKFNIPSKYAGLLSFMNPFSSWPFLL